MAVIKNTVAIDVACTPEEAFSLLADINRHPELFANNEGVRDYHGGPLKAGDTWKSVARWMGREVESTYTLTKYSPPSRLDFHTSSSSAEGDAVWEFQAVDGGTRITITAEGEPKGFFATLAATLLKGNLDRSARQNLQRIKAVLEA